MPRKQRLDIWLVEHGMAPSRQRAQSLIMAGVVLVNRQPATHAAQAVAEADKVVVLQPEHPYVSRGGLKLEQAFKTWGLSVEGQVALDVGASTGGFTDCLLQQGARKVYALDVGYGQLSWRLRQDPRVIPIERTNIRHWSGEEMVEPPSCVVIDVSFISLRKVIPPIEQLLSKIGATEVTLVLLIKPQFEAGRKAIGSGGIVRDDTVIEEVVNGMEAFVRDRSWSLIGVTPSPIRGAKGNREFLLGAHKSFCQ